MNSSPLCHQSHIICNRVFKYFFFILIHLNLNLFTEETMSLLNVMEVVDEAACNTFVCPLGGVQPPCLLSDPSSSSLHRAAR